MPLDGVFADLQRAGDFAIGRAAADQMRDLLLASASAKTPSVAGAGVVRRRLRDAPARAWPRRSSGADRSRRKRVLRRRRCRSHRRADRNGSTNARAPARSALPDMGGAARTPPVRRRRRRPRFVGVAVTRPPCEKNSRRRCRRRPSKQRATQCQLRRQSARRGAAGGKQARDRRRECGIAARRRVSATSNISGDVQHRSAAGSSRPAPRPAARRPAQRARAARAARSTPHASSTEPSRARRGRRQSSAIVAPPTRRNAAASCASRCELGERHRFRDGAARYRDIAEEQRVMRETLARAPTATWKRPRRTAPRRALRPDNEPSRSHRRATTQSATAASVVVPLRSAASALR